MRERKRRECSKCHLREYEYEVKYRGLHDQPFYAYFPLRSTYDRESKEAIHPPLVRARFPLSWMVAARLARPRVRHDFIFVASDWRISPTILHIHRVESFLSPENGRRGEESSR